ncbi:AAA domain protein [Leptospira ryugenii]|uniref:AAA domain protein n=1 Tax=Leptospira ryugenii TaxID=1917863 RepID=A0A2P2DY26_9LEPT|nr:AAA domain protein [Leptospira ryugenii]
MPQFTSLEEEIQFQTKRLALEREKEREQFTEKNQNQLKLKKCILEEIQFLYGNTWKVSFSHTNFSSINDWHKGQSVLIQSESESTYGHIVSIDKSKIIIQSLGEQEWESDEYEIIAWFQESTYKMYEEVVHLLGQDRFQLAKKKLSWILSYSKGDKPSTPKAEVSPIEKLLSLNEYGFVFGPPGTGKTFLLMNTAEAIIAKKQKLLVLCPNNYACDMIVERAIAKDWNVIRLGNSTKIKETALAYHLDSLVEKDHAQRQIQKWQNELKSIQKKYRSWKRNFGKEEREERQSLKKEAKDLLQTIKREEENVRQKIFDKAEMIVGTFSSYFPFLKKGILFDYVFVDEATQATDVACYMAMMCGSHCFYFGDPKQLPYTYLLPEHQKIPSFLEKGILEDQGERTVFLNTQFRMLPEIVKFPNQYFYENQVQTSPNVKHNQNIQNEMLRLFYSDKSLLWIDTAGTDNQEERNKTTGSIFNLCEADLVTNFVKNGLNPNLCQILTPYSEQKERIERMTNYSIPVQTFDSFQGRESDMVVISFVRTNDENSLGFLADERRLNVALTRAKFALVLIGDSSTLCTNPIFERLYESVKELGEIKSIYEYLSL